MNNEDVPSVRFAGRTYSRRSKATDDGSTVQVKAAVSMSKWGKANYVPYREESDPIGSDIKRMKTEIGGGEDPFSFDSEDKSKSPTKRQPVADRTTLLPASRIVTSGKDVKAEIEKVKSESAFQTYTRTPVTEKKDEITDDGDDQFMAVGQTFVNKEGDRVFIAQKDESVEEEEDDDIFPVEFKREPLKTYAGEVITPHDKPDSPPLLKKGRYVKKGGQRGRKPLTVSDPGLIEQYKKNYAAQQQRGKRDTDTGGLNNSMVVSKQEVTNEDQGKVVVVVCKPKNQIEKGDVQSKYFTRTPRKQGLTVLETATTSDSASSQEVPNGGKNMKTELNSSPGVSQTRTRAQQRTTDTSSGSQSSTPASPVVSAISKRVTRGRLSNTDWTSPSSTTSNESTSASQGDSSGGKATGKRYRIFKTRAQADEKQSVTMTMTVENETTSNVQNEDTESPLPVSQSTASSQEVLTEQSQITEETDAANGQELSEEVLQDANEEISETYVVEQGVTDTDNDNNMEVDQPPANQTLMTCVKNLATRLKESEKDDSDSTEPDNASECSDNLMMSQESPANSQSTEEKEESVAPRRFFKSKKSLSNSSDLKRKLLSASPQKSPAKATYNARSWQNESNDGDKEEEVQKFQRRLDKGKDDTVLVRDSSKAPRLSREVHWPERKYDEAYTSLRVTKKHKELYTVVHNVKQTHEVQELGETQDFMDDVDYLLDSLRTTNSTSIRCLSCLKLAGKCIMPAFRMHIRAHGTVTKIFSLLHDACKDPCLALSTSAMMFMLSRDRLNMDLDKESLDLMLKLNEVDSAEKGKASDASMKELEKTKERVKELLAQLQQETQAREIDLGFVSTGNLAMESLLSLTSRRAGEWFKEELRSVGGLDHIVDSVVSSEKQLPEDMERGIQTSVPSLRKLDRCLRVLENVSFMNTDNKIHLVNYKNGALLTSCGRTLRLCQKCMPSFKVLESVEENKAIKDLPGFTIMTTMMAVLRLLLNITHDHSKEASNYSKAKDKVMMEIALQCLINTQWCIPVEQRFDLAVLSLGLLINLLEGRQDNRTSLMEIHLEVRDSESSEKQKMSAVHAIVHLFVQREEAAREMEEDAPADTSVSSESSPNKSGEWKETEVGIQWITNNLKKAKEEQEKQEKEQAAKEGEEQKDGGDGTGTEAGEGNQSILEDDEETFTKALHKAGKHMENSIVASYAGLLLGSVMMDNQNHVNAVKKIIPNEDFRPMIKILKKFLNFMSLTTAFGSTDVNGITKVIDVLESA